MNQMTKDVLVAALCAFLTYVTMGLIAAFILKGLPIGWSAPTFVGLMSVGMFASIQISRGSK